MKKAILLFAVILSTSAAQAIGGMVSGEPARIEAVRECQVEGIDPTFPISVAKVVEYYEPALKTTSFAYVDRAGGVLFYVPAVEVNGSNGQQYNLYRYADYQEQIGTLNYEGQFPGVKSIDPMYELIFTDCVHIASAQ